ncbi:cytochrome c [Herpetosiphon geysericola]|uniref:Cytochrome c domain-containing protein n=1 Tax=Herpetosiphon geysericola TaxID=70996 RepID=A0A0P6XTR6_9CHLR|nr:cytochrome c [Herpetosiphon geysericola]KPL86743.1 hypothetical protein SE18_12295 [Herpetosiphon geysericola]
MTKNIAVSLLFTLATVALLGFIWIGQTNDRLVATNLRQDALQLEFGQRNYEQYCATCHGLAGEGQGPGNKGAPKLSDLQGRLGPGTEAFTRENGIQKKYGSLRNYVEGIIAYGKTGTAMPAWKLQGMRDDQIKAIAAYVMSMQGGAISPVALDSAKSWAATTEAGLPPTPTPNEPPLDDAVAEAGKQTFNVYCISCHSKTDASGTGPGLAGLFGETGTKAFGTTLPNGNPVNDENVLDWITNGGGGPGVGPDPQDGASYGAMPPQGQILSEDKILEVIAYLKTLTR